MRPFGVLILCCLGFVGCSAPPVGAPGYLPALTGAAPSPIANPLFVTATDKDFIFDQICDILDDYFRLERQERPRQIGDLVTEGRIETYPETASTILEPWRADSVTPYERWESTLQSMRRRATVRLLPANNGYFVEVVVIKELEDVRTPEKPTVGDAFGNPDKSSNRYLNTPANKPQPTTWFPVRRDIALEQDILAGIQTRLRTLIPVAPVTTAPLNPLPAPQVIPTPPPNPPSAALTPVAP